MADVVKEIEITAALSADYQDAFKAASSIASSSAKELSQLTKQEAQLQQMLTLSSDAQKAAAEGNAKEAEKLTAEYDKLADKLGLVDKTAQGVEAELQKIGAQKKEVSALNEAAKKSAAFGKLAKDIQTYTKAAKKTKDPAIIKQLDQMKKKFKEMGGVIPSEKKFGFFSKLKGQLSELPGPLGKVAKGFGSIPKGALVAGGVAAVGAAAVAAAKKMWDLGVSTMNAADAIAKTSKQLGIDAESYQEFAWAVGLGGASEQDLASGLQTLNKQMEAAVSGNSKAKKAFESLGISMDEVRSMNTEEMFVRISEGLSKVDDTASKTKTMMDLFGSSGVKLGEAIKGGASALEEMRQEARDSGYVMSREDLAKAEEAADNFSRAQMQIKGMMNEIGVEVMPVVNDVLVEFVQLMRENKDTIKTFAKLMGEGFKVAGKILVGVMENIPVVIDYLKYCFDFWRETFSEAVEGVQSGLTAVGEWFSGVKDTVVGVIMTAREAFTNALLWLDEKDKWLKGLIFGTVESVIGWFTGIPDAIMGAFDALMSSLDTWWSGLKSSASDWLHSIMDSIVSYIMDKASWLSDALKELPIVGRLLEGEPNLAGSGGNVTIQVQNSIDARGAAPGAGAEISRAVSSSAGQTGASIAAALGSYNDLSYAG